MGSGCPQRLDGPGLPEIDDQTIDTLSGKASATLDLGRDHGQREELLARADLLIHGYRPGALSRFGLDPDDLAERHPHLAVVTVSAWGETGPWARRRGFDSLVQCPTGIATVEGDAPRPGVLPAQVLDHATGYLAAAAGLRALACAQRGEPVRSARLAARRHRPLAHERRSDRPSADTRVGSGTAPGDPSRARQRRRGRRTAWPDRRPMSRLAIHHADRRRSADVRDGGRGVCDMVDCDP